MLSKMMVPVYLIVFVIASTSEGRHSPIMLVPGIGGSQLTAKVGEPMPSHCRTNGKFRNIWVNVYKSVTDSEFRKCFFEDIVLKLSYTGSTETFTNQSGVEIAVRRGLKGVEYLDQNKLTHYFSQGQYFHPMVDYFVDRGYRRGHDIRAAPYDWRLAGDQLERLGYYNEMKSQIEEMVSEFGKKATLIAHSLGGPVTLYFLTHVVDQSWKDQYIHAYIPISGAWGGGCEVIQSLVSGLALIDVPQLNLNWVPSGFVPAMRSFESAYWLLPRSSNWGDTVVLTTTNPTRSYTTKDYSRLFKDIGNEVGSQIYKQTSKLLAGWPSPNVPTYCYYGTGVETVRELNYDGANFPSGKPTIVYGDGDGSVNVENSHICHKWKNEQQAPFQFKQFKSVGHIDIIKDNGVLKNIGRVVGAKPTFLDLLKDLGK